MHPMEQLPIPLLQWYQEHKRCLPWRSHPTPYWVWVSEIMLQQTRVAAVIPYFTRFMRALPTVSDLAYAEEDQLMKLWQGLGYYSRARNLQKAARQIMSDFDGVFPHTYEDILSLSGIGEYTAGAIASIAFQIPVPAVDGNVLRVAARISGNRGDIAAAQVKRDLRDQLFSILPKHQPGDFNQAMMELGATVCLPNGAPLCSQCPAASFCTAYLTGQTDSLPVKSPKKPRRVENRTVFLLFHEKKVALRRRPSKGLLASLWEYPNEIGAWSACPSAWQFSHEPLSFAASGKHVFTHVEWHMTGQWARCTDAALPDGWVWASFTDLQETYALPSAFSSFLPFVEQTLTGQIEPQLRLLLPS